jgi:hypothetical protein
MKYFQSLATAATVAAICSVPAQAAENGNTQYAPGASQFYAGSIPPFAGLYFLSQTSYFSADRVNDGQGNEIPINFDVEALAETLRFLYVSDVRVGDALLWGQLVLPLVHLDLTTPGGSDKTFGLADATATVGLAWHLDRANTFAMGIDVVFPIGSDHIGLNHWSVQPTVAYHYFDPLGFELATSARVIFNTENTATGYTSGNELVVDYAVGWNFGPVKVGAVGYYLNQFTDDRGPTAPPDGHRGEGFAVGPSITYSFDRGTQLSGSWQHDVYAENRAQGDTVWVNFATKF